MLPSSIFARVLNKKIKLLYAKYPFCFFNTSKKEFGPIYFSWFMPIWSP